MLEGQIIVELNEDWKPEGLTKSFPQGSIVSLDLEALKKDPTHLKPTVIFTPTAQEFAQEVDITKNHLLITTLDHVQGRAYVYTRSPKNIWTAKKLDIPDNIAVSIESTNTSDDQFFLGLTGFLTPSSLVLGDAATGSLKPAKTLPAQFDASNLIVEQLQATSTDGTKVPYFVVHRKDIKYDGSNPTLMTAYGGFQVSETPRYSGIVGKLWLERGGVYVLANIRGGGEFGPAWHEAGLKTHRQRIYDDFASVARDMFTRKITSPRRLGIVGGSNGGLLMGVEFTQHPEHVERRRHPGPPPRHAPLRTHRRRCLLGRRIRHRHQPRRAQVPRLHLPLQPAQPQHHLPRTPHLHHHQRRPGRPRPRAQIRRQTRGVPQALLLR